MDSIKLNDILKLSDLSNVKVRFNQMFEGNWNPIELFNEGRLDIMLQGHYHNYKRARSYKKGQVTIGFVRIKPREHQWLLFHVGRVTEDLNRFEGVGYEYEELPDFKKYFGRLVVRYQNKVQAMVRRADQVFDDCEVVQILPSVFDNDLFPGYDKVHIPWRTMQYVLEKESWNTALKNMKGVYLVTDDSNGKMYVGIATGQEMLLARWKSYIQSGHGGNQELKNLPFDHIRKHFRYSILEIFKASTDDDFIKGREIWWKRVLQSNEFGYNRNY